MQSVIGVDISQLKFVIKTSDFDDVYICFVGCPANLPHLYPLVGRLSIFVIDLVVFHICLVLFFVILVWRVFRFQ